MKKNSKMCENDDAFALRRLSHLNKQLETELTRAHLAHEELNTLYCEATTEIGQLEDNLSEKSAGYDRAVAGEARLAGESERMVQELQGVNTILTQLREEAGLLRDERTTWKNRARLRLRVSIALACTVAALAALSLHLYAVHAQ